MKKFYNPTRLFAGYAGIVGGPALIIMTLYPEVYNAATAVPPSIRAGAFLLGAFALFLGCEEVRDQRRNRRIDTDPLEEIAAEDANVAAASLVRGRSPHARPAD